MSEGGIPVDTTVPSSLLPTKGNHNGDGQGKLTQETVNAPIASMTGVSDSHGNAGQEHLTVSEVHGGLGPNVGEGKNDPAKPTELASSSGPDTVTKQESTGNTTQNLA